MKVHELLKNPKNWCKGSFQTMLPDGSYAYCLSGAIGHCYSDTEYYDIYKQVQQHLNIHNKQICTWNDDEKRTHKEVLKVAKELDI